MSFILISSDAAGVGLCKVVGACTQRSYNMSKFKWLTSRNIGKDNTEERNAISTPNSPLIQSFCGITRF